MGRHARGRGDRVQRDRLVEPLETSQTAVYDDLGLGPRYENPGVHGQRQPAEAPLAQHVGKRLTGRAPVEQPLELDGRSRLQLTPAIRANLAPRASEHVREQEGRFRATLEHILARTQPETDLYVFSNLSMDTLDYTGPAVNEGSKGVWLGLGDPVRELPRQFSSPVLPAGVTDVFVTKVDQSGSRVYSTYIGGTGADEGVSIVVDQGGDAIVTGATASANRRSRAITVA